MSDSEHHPITQLLNAAGRGDAGSEEKLWTLVYNELRGMARQQMAVERSGHTLQPTALVHEAYLRLFGNTHVDWADRRHFFATASLVMRRIRVDDARKRKRIKRGSGETPVSTEETPDPAVFEQDPAEVLAIDEALEKLKSLDPRKAQIVTLRYFAGLNVDETAAALDVSPRTVDGDWRLARAWLHRELSKGDTALNNL